MDAFGSAFRNTVRDYVGLYEENKQLKKREKALKQALNICTVCTITGPGGFPVYAAAARPGFDMANPQSWEGNHERIDFLPVIHDDDEAEQQEQRHCPIEDILNVECRVGNRVFRLAETESTICGNYDVEVGYLRYVYFFNSSPNVHLAVFVDYKVNPEITMGWDIDRLYSDDLANPSNFRNDQVTSPVEFPGIWFKQL